MKTQWAVKVLTVISAVLLSSMTGTTWAADAVAPAAAAPATGTATTAADGDVAASLEALKQRNQALEQRLADLETKWGNSPEAKRDQQAEIRSLVEKTLAENKGLLTRTPGWLENLKFSGDLLLRYEYRDKASDENRDKRARARLRFGFEKSWPDEDLLVGFCLATASDGTDPTSSNQTFVGFQKYPIWVDRAYAQWTPKAVKGLQVSLGKIPNPWETSDLVWDPDVNPDGAWARYNVPGLGSVTPFVGAGAFQLFTSDTKKDASLKAFDLGVRWQIAKDVKFTSAVTYFNYTNVNSAFVNGALGTRSGDNTLVNKNLASNYNTLDFVNKVDFVAFGQPWTVFIDGAHNTDSARLPANTSDGIAIGAKVGQNKKKGDWSASYVWKDLEANAVLAAFTENTFGWNSLTNRRGSQFGATYNITDSLTAGVSLFMTEPIVGTSHTNRFTLQADLVWKF